jgi:eukaryotic-like serine/threonine-protein kinase
VSIDPDDPRLLAVARAIDEDAPIDWHVEESSMSGDEVRAVLSELAVLDRVTRVARDPDHESTKSISNGQPAANDQPTAPIGRWGPLTILEEIGRGVFGRVYRARDNLGRDVALKLFRNPDDSARLMREGELLARVRHANVIDVYGAGEFDGQVGLWMELIRGRSLEDELKARGAFSADEARLIGQDLCRALAAVHEAGLVHRDVKAQNVMREQGGRIVLMDFGAGVAAEAGDQRDVAGTPMYLAPEVFTGQPASPVSDIYSLGVLLYHLVTGVYPISGATRAAIEQAHAEGRFRRLRDARPDLPDGFVSAVEAALSFDPGRRCQTAGEMEHALLDRRGPAPLPPRPRPPRWLTATMATMAILVTVTLAWMFKPSQDHKNEQSTAVTTVPTPLPPSPADGSYTVSGRFYRFSKGKRTNLDPGDRVAPGDELGFEIAASVPVFVYVINEDDHGEAYLLFPLPGQEPSNPLSGKLAHQLPGDGNGYWQVTSAGGREHFVVYVSPDHIAIFDGLSQSLPHPMKGRPIARTRLPESALIQLRGVGGLVRPASGTSPAHYLFEGAAPLGGEPETIRGTWVRQIALQNPGS